MIKFDTLVRKYWADLKLSNQKTLFNSLLHPSNSITTLTPSHQPIKRIEIKKINANDEHFDGMKMSNPSRPLSPHLSIYKIQLTSSMSIFHRITGSFLATTLYASSLYSLLPSHAPLHFFTNLLSTLPLPILLSIKFSLIFPFIYHSLNGVRHLIWDTGAGLSLRGVYLGGWTVNLTSLTVSTILSIL